MRVAYLTAGAGGMYCGSCLHDNALARALSRQGVDIQLIPTYTPIRTDEDDVSIDQVFFGGINVYLQQRIPLFRYLPAAVDRFLDRPWLLRKATSRGMQTSAKLLGSLTVSMLRGASGYQRKEVRRLCRWLATTAQPQLVHLSNILIAGCLPELRRELGVPLLVTLQGDDVFLKELVEPYKSRAFEEIRRLVPAVDGFVVFSDYYAEFMTEYLGIPSEKTHVVPLGIDTHDFQQFLPAEENTATQRPPTIGYLARLDPEKGLHILVDAFLQLKQMPGHERTQLRIAGWQGARHQEYTEEQFDKLRQAGLADDFHVHGTVDRAGKLEFLEQVDVVSVPTTYRDPKGLFVLESLAAGVPVVQPDHGAFPELLKATGGGRLVAPEDPSALASGLAELLTDHETRHQLGRAGQQSVHDQFHADAMAAATLDVYRRFVEE